jgi:hypothetical protein
VLADPTTLARRQSQKIDELVARFHAVFHIVL